MSVDESRAPASLGTSIELGAASTGSGHLSSGVRGRDSTDEERAITQVAERLRTRLPGVDSERLLDVIAKAHDRFKGSRVRAFLPILVEREALDHFTETTTSVEGGVPASADGDRGSRSTGDRGSRDWSLETTTMVRTSAAVTDLGEQDD